MKVDFGPMFFAEQKARKSDVNKKENPSEDINTWTIDQLVEKTSSLYLTTLKPMAQTIEMKKYKNILSKGKHVEGLYPTLYDFLAFRALNYFKNSRYSLRKFNQDFKLKPKNAFTSAQTFRQYPFVVNDSLKYNALLIYQKLLNFHKDGKYLEAKMHIDRHPDRPRLITINSWNEWTEGSYLLPDARWGYAYLEAVRKVFLGL